MKIAKEFSWEMGHRLPNHESLCRNVHGHSYRMIVEVIGDVSDNGMIIDFFDLDGIVNPILEKYDHAFLCWEKDKSMLEFLNRENVKRVIVNYQSTVENICSDLLNQVQEKIIKFNNIEQLSIRVYESPNAYAEQTKIIEH